MPTRVVDDLADARAEARDRGHDRGGDADAGQPAHTPEGPAAGEAATSLVDHLVDLFLLLLARELGALLNLGLLRYHGLSGGRRGDAAEEEREAVRGAERLVVVRDDDEAGDEAEGGERREQHEHDHGVLGARARGDLHLLGVRLDLLGPGATDAAPEEDEREQPPEQPDERVHSVVLSPISLIASSSATPARSQVTIPSGIGPMCPIAQ